MNLSSIYYMLRLQNPSHNIQLSSIEDEILNLHKNSLSSQSHPQLLIHSILWKEAPNDFLSLNHHSTLGSTPFISFHFFSQFEFLFFLVLFELIDNYLIYWIQIGFEVRYIFNYYNIQFHNIFTVSFLKLKKSW